MVLDRLSRALSFGAILIATGAMLGGCSDSLPSLPKVSELNPFKETVPPLPGKRIPVLPAQERNIGELAEASGPIVLPPPRLNEAWTQAGGEPNNSPGHLALSGSNLKQAWSASAGKGTTKVGRVTATPIVLDDRVFALDSEGSVSAVSVSGGSALWKVSLKPTTDKQSAGGLSVAAQNILYLTADDGGGYGGGLAADGGRIFAVSGYGAVIALDPANGNRIWEKNLGVPIRVAPTATMDRVFVLTVEGRLYCLSTIDGAELWVVRGLPQQASLGLNASPAVDGDVVVVPYATGDLVALRVADGSGLWSESLSRSRTTSQLASMSDAARPVVDNGTVFAVGHGGRMVATVAKTGERLWSLTVPGTQPPYVAGDSVFVVDTQGQLMAVHRRDGRVQWTTKLPGSNTWAGPVLANGILWLVSKEGQLTGVEAATGRVTGQMSIGDTVYIPPVVAQGRMFVLTDAAKLVALN
ncbi:PQQ-binding-like beta-propeller repeat protein [Hyphomicrobium sp.]|uniref:outer membrane protein assembly factor BamB family protein n=1 Tax=Hyphomicrobium sp. TaxID=82 RepID=UPI0025BB0465|nr:PQQ-binding-like beta-propeller repeat protein [Hyphomicrobium sp.]MCC7250605.1 PQQ-binding-like beta-propeller repeat protein [Hyphomicrobium sp.]